MLKNTILPLLVLPILSGLMMYFGWPVHGYSLLLFVGISPLFFILDAFESYGKVKRFLFRYLALISSHAIWIGCSTFWLYDSSPKTQFISFAFPALIFGFFMVPVLLIQNVENKKWRNLAFILAWLSMEFFNQYWLIGTPYFSLGSGFGMHPEWIQHFEFIGAEGGSVWVLFSNFLVYQFIYSIIQKKQFVRKGIIAALVVFTPILYSLVRMNVTEKESDKLINALILHTYFDPYSDSLVQSPEKAVDYLWSKTENHINSQTDLILWPETALANAGWMTNMANETATNRLSEKLKNYPNTTVCSGGYGYSVPPKGEENNPYARYVESGNYFYYTHNVALSYQANSKVNVRSKQNFVPFQERIPMLETFPFLVNFADIVGVNTMFAPYENATGIHQTINKVSYAPILCYESVYPVFMAKKSKDVHFMVILANELWNKSFTGSEQYLYSNVAVAIQSRKSILKSSNDGISAYINSKGRIEDKHAGKNGGVIAVNKMSVSNQQTIYESISGIFYSISLILFCILSLTFLTRFMFKI